MLGQVQLSVVCSCVQSRSNYVDVELDDGRRCRTHDITISPSPSPSPSGRRWPGRAAESGQGVLESAHAEPSGPAQPAQRECWQRPQHLSCAIRYAGMHALPCSSIHCVVYSHTMVGM